MKVAVVGAGYWGKNHIRDYHKLGAEVTVCDLVDENIDYVKENYPGIKTTKNVDEVLNDPEIKAVSLAVPNHLHFEMAKKFLNAGKHTLLEKPMALNSAHCQELIDLAKEKSLVLAVGHIFRFNNALRELKEMMDTGALGEIYLAKLAWTNLDPIYEGRDVLFDLAPHAFDIVNYLFGRNPDEIAAVGQGYRRDDAEEVAFVNAKLGKTIVNLEISWLTPEKIRRAVVVGSKKSAFVDCLKQKLEIYDNDSKTCEVIPVQASNALTEEISHFLNCVRKGEANVADGEIGRAIIFILEKAKESMDAGQVLKL
jgi:predicted dehydrogenase